jgi:hypothetical protein
MSVKQNGNRTGKRKLHSANWKPGQSGNPKGRPRAGHSIRELMAMRVNNDEFVDRVLELAMEGNATALREVLERLDGKVPQGLVGGDGETLTSAITVKLVTSDSGSSDS